MAQVSLLLARLWQGLVRSRLKDDENLVMEVEFAMEH
jgi:hypothetical protein